MHGAHDGEALEAALVEGVDQAVVGGQVLDMGGRVVDEAVTPGQVEDGVGPSHPVVDVGAPVEDVDVEAPRPLVDAVEARVDDADVEAPFQQRSDDVTADVATGTGYEDSLHHGWKSTNARGRRWVPFRVGKACSGTRAPRCPGLLALWCDALTARAPGIPASPSRTPGTTTQGALPSAASGIGVGNHRLG